MEDRRHQVFVSSTFFDLKDERAAVVSALLQMEAFPAGMELFPAADDDAWSLITRVIDSSDYYLLVIGGKYGSVDPETEISWTEKEYDYAVEQGKPVMAFLHEDPGSIALDKSESNAEAREKLEAFREKVKKAKHVRFWKGAENLQGQVALSFSDFRTRYPAVGWVRGDVETSTETLAELNELRKRVVDTEHALAAATAGPPQGAEDLSQGNEEDSFLVEWTATAHLTDGIYPTNPTIQGSFDAELTWDEIFSYIGPEMLDEAEEKLLSRRVGELLNGKFGFDVEERTEKWAEREGRPIDVVSSVKTSMKSEDFGTLIVQLRAVGLIKKSVRNRSVKDRGTYWTLTAYGDDHLTNLRAIRRSNEGLGTQAPAPAAKKAKGSKRKGRPSKKAQ